MPNAILPPFSSVPIPQYMRNELSRRKDKYGSTYSPNRDADLNSAASGADYKGAMTAWMRVVSNATHKNKQGFVLHASDGFNNSYGIGNKVDGRANVNVIGYDRLGNPHLVDNEISKIQKHRPIPGVESIEVDIRKNIYRAAFIKWKCYSVDQLNYMSNYMFTPYTTVLLEWGWNNYNRNSLMDITSIGSPAEYKRDSNGKINPYVFKNSGTGLLGAYTNPLLIEEKLELSNGQYDAMIGHIINFNFTFNPSEMCFNCTTEIASNSKFYFGLSLDKSTAEDKVGENVPKLTVKTLFENDIHSKLLSYVKDRSSPKSVTRVDIDGRVFLPSAYNETIGGSPHKFSDELYISFGLMVDLINDVTNTNEGGLPQFFINIKDTKIGAHPNLISCSPDFLIPNAIAPYFSPENLADEIPGGIPPNWKLDQPIDKENQYRANESSNILMDNVLHNKSKRQNLSSIINYLRPNPDAKDICIPMLTDTPNSLYYGNLENIYLNYKFVESSIANSKNIKDALTFICESLNKMCNIWRLEVVHGNTPNTLSIRDTRFLDLTHIKNLKGEMGILHTEPLIYYFDSFSQESIVKEFSFNVKLSDIVAGMVLYHANSELTTDGKKTTTNERFLFNKVSDYLLTALKTNRTGGNEVEKPDPKKLKESIRIFEDFRNNIDPNILYFEKKSTNGSTNVTRLRLPDNQRSKLISMLDDDTNVFTNISSMPMPGVKVELSILGIAGFRTFQVFGVKNLPVPYDNGVLFQVTEIKHSINSEGWTTRVTAAVRPVKSLQTVLT